MKRQNTKKNLGAQEPWVDFGTHKCDQDPLRAMLLKSTRSNTMVDLYRFAQEKNSWYFTA